MTHNHHFVKATVLYVEHRQTNKSSLNQARLKHTVFDFINNNNNSIIGKLSYLFVLWEWTRGVRRHLSSSFTRRASNFSKLAATFLPFCFSSYFFRISRLPVYCLLDVAVLRQQTTGNKVLIRVEGKRRSSILCVWLRAAGYSGVSALRAATLQKQQQRWMRDQDRE